MRAELHLLKGWFLYAMLQWTDALLCYDSSFPSPHSTHECSDGMVCYQEYYAIAQGNDRVDQYFERFCVARRECRMRGFHGVCTNFDSFDPAIKDTFEKYRLHNKGVNRTALAFSKFCCCDTPLCNSFDAGAAEREFQLTASGAIKSQIFGITLLFTALRWLL
ncbi:unnamed protein product, partial [Mesorhabditis spiculigera]